MVIMLVFGNLNKPMKQYFPTDLCLMGHCRLKDLDKVKDRSVCLHVKEFENLLIFCSDYKKRAFKNSHLKAMDHVD